MIQLYIIYGLVHVRITNMENCDSKPSWVIYFVELNGEDVYMRIYPSKSRICEYKDHTVISREEYEQDPNKYPPLPLDGNPYQSLTGKVVGNGNVFKEQVNGKDVYIMSGGCGGEDGVKFVYCMAITKEEYERAMIEDEIREEELRRYEMEQEEKRRAEEEKRREWYEREKRIEEDRQRKEFAEMEKYEIAEMEIYERKRKECRDMEECERKCPRLQ